MSEPRDYEAEVKRLRNRMMKILSDLSVGMEQPEQMNEALWVPVLDVLENKDDIIVKVDIPGVNPEDIDLSITGNAIYIKGERKREVGREDENYHIIERVYGPFVRKIILPTPVDNENIKANYKKGVLTIQLPKVGEKKAGEIKVGIE